MPTSSTERWEDWNAHVRLLQSLHHPGLARVTEAFYGSGRHRRSESMVAGQRLTPDSAASWRYIVMPLVEGPTIRQWLDANQLQPISQRFARLSTVASALDAMHSGEQTPIPAAHGDVKPGYVVLSVDGPSVLVDLGLARISDAFGRGGLTPAYAAPELFDAGAKATPDADRFAFVATARRRSWPQAPPAAAADVGCPHRASV